MIDMNQQAVDIQSNPGACAHVHARETLSRFDQHRIWKQARSRIDRASMPIITEQPSAEPASEQPGLSQHNVHVAAWWRNGWIKRCYPKVSSIMRVCCAESGITLDVMTSTQRMANVVRPRQIAMYLTRVMTPTSLPEIGRRFGRDHTTVLHAVRKIESLDCQGKVGCDLAALKTAILTYDGIAQ